MKGRACTVARLGRQRCRRTNVEKAGKKSALTVRPGGPVGIPGSRHGAAPVPDSGLPNQSRRSLPARWCSQSVPAALTHKSSHRRLSRTRVRRPNAPRSARKHMIAECVPQPAIWPEASPPSAAVTIKPFLAGQTPNMQRDPDLQEARESGYHRCSRRGMGPMPSWPPTAGGGRRAPAPQQLASGGDKHEAAPQPSRHLAQVPAERSPRPGGRNDACRQGALEPNCRMPHKFGIFPDLRQCPSGPSKQTPSPSPDTRGAVKRPQGIPFTKG